MENSDAEEISEPAVEAHDENGDTDIEAPAEEIRAPAAGGAARFSDKDFDELYRQWKISGDPLLRERMILMHRNLVTFLARRFSDRGDGLDDVIQQGMVALIYALDHFDPSRGVRFATFATPTVVGEMRRYFRDKARGLRVPRRVQELHLAVSSRVEALTQELNRSPTYWEIAQAVNLTVEEVIEALETGRVMEIASLDEPVAEAEEGAISLADQMGEPDPAIARWDENSLLRAALRRLNAKQRAVLEAAYFQNKSQVEIANEMKVSQMHISRLLRSALAQLRQYLEEER